MRNKAEQLWQQIIEKGESVEENFKESLNLQQGATDKDFELVESTLGVRLPEEMKSLYSIHNGQVWNTGGNAFVRNLT